MVAVKEPDTPFQSRPVLHHPRQPPQSNLVHHSILTQHLQLRQSRHLAHPTLEGHLQNVALVRPHTGAHASVARDQPPQAQLWPQLAVHLTLQYQVGRLYHRSTPDLVCNFQLPNNVALKVFQQSRCPR